MDSWALGSCRRGSGHLTLCIPKKGELMIRAEIRVGQELWRDPQSL